LRAGQSLMVGALLGACFLAFSPAAAEPLSDSEKIMRLERQTELLQKELKTIRGRDRGDEKEDAKGGIQAGQQRGGNAQ